MDERTEAFAAGGEREKMRAADADRDRVVEVLNAAYSEGRLSRDEHDDRLQHALSARTYADLDLLVTDLPGGQAIMVPPVSDATVVTPVATINGLAMASFACGLAQFVFGPLTTIPAIVLGHMARHQIKRTGEQGAGLALAGLLLGWAAVIFGIVFMAVAVVMSARMSGPAQMQPLPAQLPPAPDSPPAERNRGGITRPMARDSAPARRRENGQTSKYSSNSCGVGRSRIASSSLVRL